MKGGVLRCRGNGKGIREKGKGEPPVRRQRPESLQQHGRGALQPRPLAVATANNVAVGGSSENVVGVFRVVIGVLRGQRGLGRRVRVHCRVRRRVWRRAGRFGLEPPGQRAVVLDRRLRLVLILSEAENNGLEHCIFRG